MSLVPISGRLRGAQQWLLNSVLKAGSLGIGLAALIAPSSTAAERVVVRVGPLSQAIELADLETFAETGEVPAGLQLYEQFLSPSLQRTLKQELALDPGMSDRIIEDVLRSANGELLHSYHTELQIDLMR